MLSKNQIKEIQGLQQKKQRDVRQRFVAEGIKTVSEIIEQQPAIVEEVFATVDFINRYKAATLPFNLTQVSNDELERISGQQAPNQALAVCRYFSASQQAFDFEKNFALYLDDVRDPGNFGTIVRLADWFGVSTVFCSPTSCDLYNPKVIQSTMGAFLRVQVVYIELQELLRRHDVKHVYAAVLNGENLYKQPLQNGLILIGNEANGISEANIAMATQGLTIPANQANGTESLNAAMATSIIVSEFFRQLRLN